MIATRPLSFFSLFYHYLDNPEHIVQIEIHIVVPKPDNFYSIEHHLSLFEGISAYRFTEVMRIPIQFDSQADGRSEEIEYIRSNRLLPVKINAAHLLSLQVLPEYNFTFGTVVSQLPGLLFQFRFIWKDAFFHTTGMN